MAITVLPKQGSFGETLGTGIGEALQALANMKLNETLQQKQLAQQQAALAREQSARQSGLEPLFGAEQAKALSLLQPELLKPLITEKARSQRQLAETGPGIQTIAPELTPAQASKIGSLPKGVQGLWYKNYLQSPQQAINALDSAPQNFDAKSTKAFAQQNVNDLKKGPVVQQGLPIKPEVIKKTESILPKGIKGSTIVEPEKIKPEFVEKPKNLAEYMKEGFSRDEAKDIAKDERKRIAQSEKESYKYYQDTLKEASGAEGFDKRLDRMTNLIDKGSLPTSLFYNLFEHLSEHPVKTQIPLVGSVVDLVLNGVTQSLGGVGRAVQRGITARDTEEFEKLTNDFVRDAKNIYGSRITNYDLEQFLKIIPSLSQTDNGKRAVIRNLKNFNEAVKLKADAVKSIIKENKGRRPANLELLVQDRIKPEMDRLAQEFVQGNKENNLTEKPEQLPFQQILNGGGLEG